MELWIIQGVNFGLMGLLGLPPSSQTWVAGKSIIESDALPGKQPMCEGFLVAMFDYWRVLTIQRDVFDFGMKKIGESLKRWLVVVVEDSSSFFPRESRGGT